MATELQIVFLLFLMCFLLGLCSAIGWYLIYMGCSQFIFKTKLKLIGREGTAQISKKWMGTKATEIEIKTTHIMTYRFMFEQNEYYIDHIIPDNETLIALHNLTKTGETINIWFNPNNPMMSLPKVIETYPKLAFVKKIVAGILVIILNGAACFGLIIALEQDHDINMIIKIINLSLVIIGYPLLILIIRYTLCKNINSEDDKKRKRVKSIELHEVNSINSTNKSDHDGISLLIENNDNKLEKQKTSDAAKHDENDNDENEDEAVKDQIITTGMHDDEFIVQDDDNQHIITAFQE